MRGSVLRIFPPYHKQVIAAFYALLLFLFIASADAQAQAFSFPVLKIQTQQQPVRQRAARPARAQKKRGLSPLQNNEAEEGSRVTITYNEPLSDYSAYRRGDQFVIVIPKSDAPRIRSGLRGRGFEGVQVEKRGDDTVLSFRIQPGTKARVDQQHNRLEVIFSKQGQAAALSAPDQQQPASAAASTVKPPQGTQPAAGGTPSPLANHNSTAAAQQRTAGADSTADSAAASTAPSDAAAPTDATPTPSIEGSASQPSAEKNATAVAEPTPLSSQRSTFAALKTLAARHWLPLLIGIALLASAYLGLKARRRSALQSSSTLERVELTEETEGDNTAAAAEPSRPEVAAAETQSSDEEAAPARKVKVLAVAAAAAAGLRHETTGDIGQKAAAVSLASDSIPVEQRMLTEERTGEAPVVSVETSNVEATNVEAQQELLMEAAETEEIIESNRAKAEEAELDEAFLNKEPVLPDEAPKLVAATTSNGFAAEAESERAARVMRLAELRSDDAFLKIGAAFDDPAQQVRDAAARSLFHFSADRVASFKRIMQESSRERRRKIGEAIVSSGMASEAVDDLTGASGEKAYDALLVLSLMAKAGEVQSLVSTIEEHPSTEVRLALVKLLSLSGQQEVLAAFRYLVTRDQLPIAVRSSIMEAIYQLNNPRPFDLS